MTYLLEIAAYSKLTTILSIALLTMICLLTLSLFKSHKLGKRVKFLENEIKRLK